MKNLCKLLPALLCCGAVLCGINRSYAIVGANTPFVSVEAESGTLGGGAAVESLQNDPPTHGYSSPTLEASGGAYVQLNATGQSVTLTNNTGQSITALNLRFCIPDSSGGGGTTATLDMYVNGTLRQAISLSSAQSWTYESGITANGMAETPSSGSPHDFYDETHFFVSGSAIPNGATITFQKDSANGAAFYYLDVVDMETPPAPLSQPANSLSITSYGAVSNSPSTDNTTAINNCFSACQSQGKIAWIPAGTFYVKGTGTFSPSGITIQGAGMWYSVIYGNPSSASSYSFTPTGCTLQDFCLNGNGADTSTTTTAINMKGNNWVINRLWIEHESPGVWADGTNGMVANCRIDTGWADGVNINNGNGGAGNNGGNNLTVTNCFIRGSGDDGIAINCGPSPALMMQNPTVVNCTSVAPRWANNIGIYGGQGILVSNNLCNESVIENGIYIGTFSSSAGSILSAAVLNNVIINGGDWGWGSGENFSALCVGNSLSAGVYTKNITASGNVIEDPQYIGVDVQDGTNMVIANNSVYTAGTTGFYLGHWNNGASQGSATITGNTVNNVLSGQSAYVDSSSGFSATESDNSWQGSTTGVVFYQNTSYGGTATQPIAPGNYPLSELQKLGFVGSWASSAQVPAGWTLTMYANNNFGGMSWTLTNNTPDFTQLSPNANDAVNSCRIVAPYNNVVYHLICQKSNMALDNAGSHTAGAAVTQWTDNPGNPNQEWKLVDVGDGYFNLLCQTSAMNLDNGGSVTNGSVVTQWTVNPGNINQYWKFVAEGRGIYHLICEKSGMTLDNAGSTTLGSDVTQWTDNGISNTNQNWTLEFVR